MCIRDSDRTMETPTQPDAVSPRSGRRRPNRGPLKKHLLYAIGTILLVSAFEPATATPQALSTYVYDDDSLLDTTVQPPTMQDPAGTDQPADQIPTTDPRAIIKLAKQHQLATTGHRATLHNEEPTVPIWADEVIGVEVYKDMFNLETKLKLAMVHLRNSRITLERCLELWPSDETDRARELCEAEVSEINTRWEATTKPVTNAYWSLRQLCLPNTNLALPGQGITTFTATHAIHRAERAVVSFSLIVMALISAFSAGSAVGFAVQDQMAKKKEHRLEVRLDQVTALSLIHI